MEFATALHASATNPARVDEARNEFRTIARLSEYAAGLAAASGQGDELQAAAAGAKPENGQRHDLHSSMYSAPPLTTVRQPLYEVGTCIGQKMLQLIGQQQPDAQVPPLSLIMRESVLRIA